MKKTVLVNHETRRVCVFVTTDKNEVIELEIEEGPAREIRDGLTEGLQELAS